MSKTTPGHRHPYKRVTYARFERKQTKPKTLAETNAVFNRVFNGLIKKLHESKTLKDANEVDKKIKIHLDLWKKIDPKAAKYARASHTVLSKKTLASEIVKMFKADKEHKIPKGVAALKRMREGKIPVPSSGARGSVVFGGSSRSSSRIPDGGPPDDGDGDDGDDDDDGGDGGDDGKDDRKDQKEPDPRPRAIPAGFFSSNFRTAVTAAGIVAMAVVYVDWMENSYDNANSRSLPWYDSMYGGKKTGITNYIVQAYKHWLHSSGATKQKSAEALQTVLLKYASENKSKIKTTATKIKEHRSLTNSLPQTAHNMSSFRTPGEKAVERLPAYSAKPKPKTKTKPGPEKTKTQQNVSAQEVLRHARFVFKDDPRMTAEIEDSVHLIQWKNRTNFTQSAKTVKAWETKIKRKAFKTDSPAASAYVTLLPTRQIGKKKKKKKSVPLPPEPSPTPSPSPSPQPTSSTPSSTPSSPPQREHVVVPSMLRSSPPPSKQAPSDSGTPPGPSPSRSFPPLTTKEKTKVVTGMNNINKELSANPKFKLAMEHGTKKEQIEIIEKTLLGRGVDIGSNIAVGGYNAVVNSVWWYADQHWSVQVGIPVAAVASYYTLHGIVTAVAAGVENIIGIALGAYANQAQTVAIIGAVQYGFGGKTDDPYKEFQFDLPDLVDPDAPLQPRQAVGAPGGDPGHPRPGGGTYEGDPRPPPVGPPDGGGDPDGGGGSGGGWGAVPLKALKAVFSAMGAITITISNVDEGEDEKEDVDSSALGQFREELKALPYSEQAEEQRKDTNVIADALVQTDFVFVKPNQALGDSNLLFEQNEYNKNKILNKLPMFLPPKPLKPRVNTPGPMKNADIQSNYHLAHYQHTPWRDVFLPADFQLGSVYKDLSETIPRTAGTRPYNEKQFTRANPIENIDPFETTIKGMKF